MLFNNLYIDSELELEAMYIFWDYSMHSQPINIYIHINEAIVFIYKIQ